MMEGNTFFNITLSFWTNNRPTSTHHHHQNGSTASTSAISATSTFSNSATTVNNNNVANKSDWSSLASDNHNHIHNNNPTNTNTSTNHGTSTNGHVGGGSSSASSSSSSFIEKKSPSFIFLFGTNNNNNNNNTNNNKTNNNHNYTASKSSLRPLAVNRNDSSLPLLNQTSRISHYNHQHHHHQQQHHPRNATDHVVQHGRPFPYITTTNRTTNNRHDHDHDVSKSSVSHHQDDTLTILDDLPSIRPISDDYGGGGDDDYLATFTTTDAAHNNTTININNKSTATSVDPFDSWIWSNVTDTNDSLDYWRNVFYSNSSSYYNNNHSNGSSSSSSEVNLWNKANDCIGINKFQEACLMDTMNGDTDGDNFTSTIDHIDPERSYWALVLIILPILALFGNFLVILSVYRERSLQTVTNWFIVSLAFADLFVTIPMLFCTYVMVNVDWELSETLCDLYIAIDVICSTASIFNLVAISFDRYIAVTHPIFYSKHKNDKRVIITIILVWMASFGVGLPIMLGANTSPERIPELCIFYNSDFIIYSSLWSFYVPCLIMVILYYKIFKAIHDRARKKMDHLSSSSSNKNKSTLLSNTHNTTANNTNANNNNNTQPNNNNNNANNPSTNKAKNILGIVDNSGGPHKSVTQRGPTVIDNLSLNKQLQMKSTTTTGTTGTGTIGGIMKLVDQTKVPIEAKNHNHTSIALISEININISQDNSNNTESHLDDFDDEEDDDDDDDDVDDDDLEEEPPEAIEFKNVVQHKCSNSKLVTSEMLHCSTTKSNNNNNNETNFNDPKSMDAENKGQSNNKCEMFLVEKSAQQLSTGQRPANNDPLGCQSCPKLEIKSPTTTTNINDNGSTSGFISGGGITTILDNRQDDGDNGANKNNDDDADDGGAMNPETGHDGDNGDNLTVTKPTVMMAVGVNFNDQTTNNKNNSVMARRIQLQQRQQQQLANSNNNNKNNKKNNDNDAAAAATSLVVCSNQYSKKKSRFNLGRKHKSSRKKREKVSARRERKATKTLAIVLGVFLLCWTPFFSCNIWDAICIKLHENHFIRSDCRPGMTAFLLTTWLGYMNSCANPLIYTIFNTEFRKAFRKILCSK